MHEPHRLQIQVKLLVMTQLKPKKTKTVMMVTRNLQALEMAVSYDPAVLAVRGISKSASDHVSIRVVQQIIRVHLLTFLNLIRQNELSKIFFPTTVMCLNELVA